MGEWELLGSDKQLELEVEADEEEEAGLERELEEEFEEEEGEGLRGGERWNKRNSPKTSAQQTPQLRQFNPFNHTHKPPPTSRKKIITTNLYMKKNRKSSFQNEACDQKIDVAAAQVAYL